MHRVLFATFIFAVLTQVAFAQGNQAPYGSSPGATGSAQNAQSSAPTRSAPIPQTIRQKLESAGYTDVTIMPTSFYVQARDKQGDPVEIFVTPHSLTEVHSLNANEQGAMSSSGQANPPSGGQ